MKIEIPKTCPSCGSTLELVNTQLFCRNTLCGAKSNKKIEAYAKKMKIKGLGPKTIEKLNIDSIWQLYEIDEEFLVELIGEKLGQKLYSEIECSRGSSLGVFLAALSIPLIGKKISKVVSSLGDLTEENLLKAGIGEKARANILQWMKEEYPLVKDDMPINLAKTEVPNIEQHKGNVCITGKLIDFKNRTDASQYLESLGYTVTSGVSQKTDFLVDEEGKSSSKRTKAEQLGIPIVTIKQLEEK